MKSSASPGSNGPLTISPPPALSPKGERELWKGGKEEMRRTQKVDLRQKVRQARWNRFLTSVFAGVKISFWVLALAAGSAAMAD